MLYPSINKVLEKVDSRYTLVMLVSKRARQIVDGEEPMVRTSEYNKNVTAALLEVAEKKITYTRDEEKIKEIKLKEELRKKQREEAEQASEELL